DKLRAAYGRGVARTLTVRPFIYSIWIVVWACAILMFLKSPTELAPPEDQSVIFGGISAPANATTDHRAFYAKAAEAEFLSTPEVVATFQLLFPPSTGALFGFDGFG